MNTYIAHGVSRRDYTYTVIPWTLQTPNSELRDMLRTFAMVPVYKPGGLVNWVLDTLMLTSHSDIDQDVKHAAAQLVKDNCDKAFRLNENNDLRCAMASLSNALEIAVQLGVAHLTVPQLITRFGLAEFQGESLAVKDIPEDKYTPYLLAALGISRVDIASHFEATCVDERTFYIPSLYSTVTTTGLDDQAMNKSVPEMLVIHIATGLRSGIMSVMIKNDKTFLARYLRRIQDPRVPEVSAIEQAEGRVRLQVWAAGSRCGSTLEQGQKEPGTSRKVDAIENIGRRLLEEAMSGCEQECPVCFESMWASGTRPCVLDCVKPVPKEWWRASPHVICKACWGVLDARCPLCRRECDVWDEHRLQALACQD
jgi:hypothetical protein